MQWSLIATSSWPTAKGENTPVPVVTACEEAWSWGKQGILWTLPSLGSQRLPRAATGAKQGKLVRAGWWGRGGLKNLAHSGSCKAFPEVTGWTSSFFNMWWKDCPNQSPPAFQQNVGSWSSSQTYSGSLGEVPGNCWKHFRWLSCPAEAWELPGWNVEEEHEEAWDRVSEQGSGQDKPGRPDTLLGLHAGPKRWCVGKWLKTSSWRGGACFVAGWFLSCNYCMKDQMRECMFNFIRFKAQKKDYFLWRGQLRFDKTKDQHRNMIFLRSWTGKVLA